MKKKKDIENHKVMERVFKEIEIQDGKLLLMENFIPQDKLDKYFNGLINNADWNQEKVTVFGKKHLQPRLTAWYGDGKGYKHSGLEYEAKEWIDELKDIRKVLNHFLPGDKFNSVLLNQYRDGNDKVGWHSDDEKGMGTTPTIASVSLGATRRFDLRHKETNEDIKMYLKSGSLLVMAGELQNYWRHQIPVEKKVKDMRINLTFRTII